MFVAELFRSWHFYKQGFLQDPGSMNEQSYYWMVMMHVLDAALAECQELELSQKSQAREKGPPKDMPPLPIRRGPPV